MQEQIPQNLPMTLIHGDVFFDNLIVQGERLVAIIDFEEACHYYRSFDLGMAIVGTCRNRQGISFQKVRKFLHGYQNNMSLESAERESLKTFVVYAAVEMQTLADTISEYSDSSFTGLFG